MELGEVKDVHLGQRKSVVRELTRGRESALQLRELLGLSSGGGGRLAEEVVACFTRALSALDQGESSEVCQGASSASSGDWRSAASTGKRKPQLAGDWKVSSKTLDDSYTWRKYGQKPIQNATHPRSYFRCTHKHDQGCQAMRTVQKSEENPSEFIIAYRGHHTCKSAGRSSVAGAGGDDGGPFLIYFDRPSSAPSSFPSSKQEVDDGHDADALSNLSGNDSSSDFFSLPELSPVPEMTTPQFYDVFGLDSLSFSFT
ncbi:unnamed protein product [Spirodela intermedia]|uniref:WRKY domain-containing protein n=1 Tax=Spirodela intermedia TaxID=51605 RepID=A0A7I8IVI9_SPIIN|nr:unnamed protein product [Spirodela intermedia]CAA6661878.1 unnamed protein product [Spirodela intermedia]